MLNATELGGFGVITPFAEVPTLTKIHTFTGYDETDPKIISNAATVAITPHPRNWIVAVSVDAVTEGFITVNTKLPQSQVYAMRNKPIIGHPLALSQTIMLRLFPVFGVSSVDLAAGSNGLQSLISFYLFQAENPILREVYEETADVSVSRNVPLQAYDLIVGGFVFNPARTPTYPTTLGDTHNTASLGMSTFSRENGATPLTSSVTGSQSGSGGVQIALGRIQTRGY